MQNIPNTVEDLVAIWPSVAAFSDDVGVLPIVAYRWRTRNRIPGKYLLKIYQGATGRRLRVTLDHLQRFALSPADRPMIQNLQSVRAVQHREGDG